MKKNTYLGLSEEGFHRLNYLEWGSQDFDYDYPTVFCVHGYTRNARDFDSLAYYLSMQGRHVFCPDIVGRGDSSWFHNSHHYQFKQYVDDMSILIARSNAQEIDWIGTSMGGIIGMMLASLPNNPIKRLVLNDIGPQIPIHGLRRLAKYAGKEPDFHSMQEAKEYFKTNYADFGPLTDKQWDTFTQNSIEQIGPELFRMKLDPGIKNPRSTVQLINELFHHPHKALEGIIYDIDLWSYWKKISCPVLVIHGVHSDLLTLEIIEKMKSIHPQTEVYSIEHAGHAPALLNSTEHKKIADWLLFR